MRAAARAGNAPARRAWLPELLWVLATATVTTLVMIADLELWDMTWSVPLYGSSGDAGYFLATVKDVIEHGWFSRNPDLAAPIGQSSLDFAASFGDLAHYGVIRALGLFSNDAPTVFNAFFLLGYPLVAVSAYGVLRDLGSARPVAFVVGVLFAFLFYHRLRNQQHLFLSAYYAVPLAVWLVVALAEGRTLLARASPRRSLVTLGVCLLVASASNYYAVFAMLALVTVVPLAALAWRSWRMAAQGALVLTIVIAGFAIVHSPPIINTIVNGSNEAVAKRTPAQSEQFGLKLTHMVLPRPGHRVKRLSRVGERYTATFPNADEGFSPSLGVVGTAGLAGAIIVLLLTGLRNRDVSLRHRRVTLAGAVALGCFAIGTVAGGSALIAFELTPQLRAWNRISVLIAFASLLVVALALTALGEKLRTRGPAGLAAFAVVLVLVGVVGLLDQTNPYDEPDYPAFAAQWEPDAEFVATVERRLPRGTALLQLPYVPFPEHGAVNGVRDYDHLDGYQHSKHLRWSYGATKGRPEDWHDNAQALAPDSLVVAATAAGFGAVWLDRAGYADNGAAVADPLAKLSGADRGLASADGRLQVYDLRDVAARLAAGTTASERRELGDALVRPIDLGYGDGFYYPEVAGDVPFRAAGADATMLLVNPLDGPRRATFSASLAGSGAEPATITVTLPDGRRETVVAGAEGKSVSYDITIPPGGGTLRFQTDGPSTPVAGDTRDRRMRVIDVRLVAAPLAAARLARYVAAARG